MKKFGKASRISASQVEDNPQAQIRNRETQIRFVYIKRQTADEA
jgi:hypothetical protein